MRVLKSRKGVTLMEVLLVAGLMGFVFTGAAAVMTSSFRCFENTSAQTFTDTDAVIAMQLIVTDIREACGCTLQDSGTRLTVVFPTRTADGYYDRTQPDTANPTDYYRSDSSGVIGREGTWLWRKKASGASKVLRKDVSGLLFEQPDGIKREVTITITTRNNTASGHKATELKQRVVYMRNY